MNWNAGYIALLADRSLTAFRIHATWPVHGAQAVNTRNRFDSDVAHVGRQRRLHCAYGMDEQAHR
jgi:hypothetical protein